MENTRTNPKVDKYMQNVKVWPLEISKLREVLLDCGLTETVKWAKPCYEYTEHNVAVIMPMKQSCAVLFMKGALLHDERGLLVKPGEATNAGRQMRFVSLAEIEEQEEALRDYIAQAIAVEKAGLKVEENPAPVPISPEFAQALEQEPMLASAFYGLTPGRQRAYIRYFAGAKQAVTRLSRLEKYRPKILQGKGIDE